MNNSRWNVWSLVLLFAVLVRLLTLDTYPLADTTESRYAEIARVMVDTGNWVTPQLAPDEPFWAKPPLSIWATALSFKIFGVSEFTARIPALIAMLFVVFLTQRFNKNLYPVSHSALPGVILLTSVLGFVSAGAVMTDAVLAVSTTLAMMSFYIALRDQRREYFYLFFLALGVGMLAKGPTALVVSILPIIFWTLWSNKFSQVYREVPLVFGVLIVILVSAPWYMLAEYRTPGFLEYFFIGEHFQRFVDSGWAGDKYGSAHARPRGTIWMFAFLASIPWSFIALFEVLRRNITPAGIMQSSDETKYLLCWALAPLVFFTFAGNILATYFLPGLPAFAILVASIFDKDSRFRVIPVIALLVPCIFLLSNPLGLRETVDLRSQKAVIERAIKFNSKSPVFYFKKIPYSASFYSASTIHLISSLNELVRILEGEQNTMLVFHERHITTTPDSVMNHLIPVEKHGKHVLYFSRGGFTETAHRMGLSH